MKYSITLIMLFLLAILASGCAITPNRNTFSVTVDSINDAAITNKNLYVLLPGNKDVKIEDLQFKEYATYVNRALIKHGFVPAESLEKANIAILIVYGTGDPQERVYTYSVPTKKTASSRTTGIIGSDYSNLYRGETEYTITGESTRTATYITYLRYMILKAVDLDEYKKSNEEIQLWRTVAMSTGVSSDLRRVFPILVAASQQYFGGNTGQEIKVDLNEDDDRVFEIKGITKTNKK
ncbi:MAG: hypothetical protein JSS37_08960 [Proteobacteria bacterium]|nr:hypothetical protein [Pseudomonadota bacterium]